MKTFDTFELDIITLFKMGQSLDIIVYHRFN